MTDPSTGVPADAAQLAARVKELEQERRHLLAVIEILEEISGTLHFVDILQAITRKLGEAFGLDRCSIFLAERGGQKARLVASYEDPSIRNYVVDLERYPELKQALQSGETVFIPDAANDPSLRHIKGALTNRKVRSITVVPITWRGVAIGAIFLRTFRDGPAFSETDVQFTQVVGSLTAKALRNAYRYERLLSRASEMHMPGRQADVERLAVLGFLRRFLEAFERRDGSSAEGVLPRSSSEELDRLVEIAMAVIAEEGKGH
jgi:two-component system CheB/CheR fusion protein